MTDWTPEEEETFNEVEKHSNLGKQILRDRMNKSSGMDCCTYDCIQGRDCPVRKSKWVGMSDEEMKKTWYELQNIMGWYSFQEIAKAIENKLRNKNT